MAPIPSDARKSKKPANFAVLEIMHLHTSYCTICHFFYSSSVRI